MEEFVWVLSRSYPQVCFYGYGSFVNKTCNFGVGDNDGGLILNSDVVTNKDEICHLSSDFSRCLERNYLDAGEFDFNLLDRETNRDGRFLSYRGSFVDYFGDGSFGDNARVFTGPNWMREMRNFGLRSRSEALVDAAFVLRAVRNRLLGFYNFLKNNPEELPRRVKNTLRKVSKFPMRLLEVRGELVFEKASSVDRLEEVIGNCVEGVREINSFLARPARVVYGELGG